jgi:hypothetical protein
VLIEQLEPTVPANSETMSDCSFLSPGGAFDDVNHCGSPMVQSPNPSTGGALVSGDVAGTETTRIDSQPSVVLIRNL